MRKLKEKEIENSLNEIRILASVSHPNIIAYKESFYEKETGSLCIVMDFAEGGDLQNRIKECREKKIRFTESMVIKYFYQIASALRELHQQQIIHRDLKTANVFMTKNYQDLKLGDMNVSKILKNHFAKT